MKYIVRDFEERFYAGIEYDGGITLGENNDVPKLWDAFMKNTIESIPQKLSGYPVIGLECYPPDFKESKVYDYYALVQTDGLVRGNETLITKKLPKGKYMSFEIKYDDLHLEIKKVYKYIKEHSVLIHRGFDFEEYLPQEKYYEKGAILYLSFLID